MSEIPKFFQDNSPSVAEQRNREKTTRAVGKINEGRKILSEQAQQIQHAARELAERLKERKIATTHSVVSSQHEDSRIPKRLMNTVRGKFEPYRHELPHQEELHGWEVSRSKTRHGEHAIYLIEDGTLVMGQPYPKNPTKRKKLDDPFDKYDGNHAELEGALELEDFPMLDPLESPLEPDYDPCNPPVHPYFSMEHGYALTGRDVPDVVLEGLVVYNTPDFRVAVNLDYLECGLRANGRKLLDSRN